MLKLEKVPKSSTLTLRFRDREVFFDSQLLKAMGIALFLHTAGWVLFQVSPFTLSSTFVFPPVEVQSDQPLPGALAVVTTHLRNDEELPPPPLNLMPRMDWAASTPISLLMPEIALNTDALQTLEERNWPAWHSPIAAVLEEPKVRLSTSGDLAHYAVIAADPSLEIKVPFKADSDAYAYVSYEVLLDERRGELFWYERIQSSGIDAVDRLTEKILLNMRYAVQRSEGAVGGILNFTVFIGNE